MFRYLKHDVSIRRTEPMSAFVRSRGMFSYGVLWALYEKMAMEGGYVTIDWKALSKELGTNRLFLRLAVGDLLESGFIFRTDTGSYYSREVCSQLAAMERKNDAFPPRQDRKRSGTSKSYHRRKYK